MYFLFEVNINSSEKYIIFQTTAINHQEKGLAHYKKKAYYIYLSISPHFAKSGFRGELGI